MSQAAVWRLVMDKQLWRGARVAVSDEAVYKRLAAPGASPLGTLFAELTAQLRTRVAPWQERTLAPFARAVVAIDETTLDPVARSLPSLRAVPSGDHALLPGKLAGVFDVRRRLWTRLELIANPHQNEKIAARALIADLVPGTLVLADMGYFSFRWFDELTEAGHFWLSRVPARVSLTVVHTLVVRDAYREQLVFLGRYRADRNAHLVRLVQYASGRGTHTFLTNVCDPAVLPVRDMADLYARRWDIELAVKLVKRDLGLHLLWSAKPTVITHQIWAVLLIAQIWQALRTEIAGRAGVPIDDVSLPLLVREFPATRPAGPIRSGPFWPMPAPSAISVPRVGYRSWPPRCHRRRSHPHPPTCPPPKLPAIPRPIAAWPLANQRISWYRWLSDSVFRTRRSTNAMNCWKTRSGFACGCGAAITATINRSPESTSASNGRSICRRRSAVLTRQS